MTNENPVCKELGRPHTDEREAHEHQFGHDTGTGCQFDEGKCVIHKSPRNGPGSWICRKIAKEVAAYF